MDRFQPSPIGVVRFPDGKQIAMNRKESGAGGYMVTG